MELIQESKCKPKILFATDTIEIETREQKGMFSAYLGYSRLYSGHRDALHILCHNDR